MTSSATTPENIMDCPNCTAPHSAAARFCARCGTPLHATIDRTHHFAAHPDEPVRALAVMSTLMPHLSGRRHHDYRNAVGLTLLASLVAAAFGVLAVALVLAAVALPAILLTYIHDHDVWRDEPITVVGVGFLLPLLLGVGVGLLEQQLAPGVLLTATGQHLPPVGDILTSGVAVPVVVFIAVLVVPALVTARQQFRHPIDALNLASLAGAALSLGLSVVVQRGAFSHAVANTGDPARTAFIALTLGFLQPVVFATAAAVAVIRLRRPGANLGIGIGQGLVLVLAYQLATTVLGPSGPRGIVLTALVALIVAGAGLLAVRGELHTGLLAEAQAALAEGTPPTRAAAADQVCAHCGAGLGTGAAFCQACGSATAALPRTAIPTSSTTALTPSAI